MSGCPSTSVQAYEDCGAVGAPGVGTLAKYNSLDPNAAAIKAAVAASTPPGADSSYAIVCEAMLRSGGLLYWKNNPGDCPAPTAPGGISSGQIAGLSGQAATGALSGIQAAGVISGPLTLGIGTAITSAVSAIESIFAHHAQAVADEQSTICGVAGYFNQAKQQIDNAVRSGQISPDAGVTYLTQVANQAKSGLSSIVKTCNAACYFQGFLQAFINYSRTWYDYISPSNMVFAQAPGGPPTSYGTPPGGVTTSPANPAPPIPIRASAASVYAPAGPNASGVTAPPLTANTVLPGNANAADYLNLGYNQPTGQSAGEADVPPSSINWNMIAAIAAVVLLLITLMNA